MPDTRGDGGSFSAGETKGNPLQTLPGVGVGVGWEAASVKERASGHSLVTCVPVWRAAHSVENACQLRASLKKSEMWLFEKK